MGDGNKVSREVEERGSGREGCGGRRGVLRASGSVRWEWGLGVQRSGGVGRKAGRPASSGCCCRLAEDGAGAPEPRPVTSR